MGAMVKWLKWLEKRIRPRREIARIEEGNSPHRCGQFTASKGRIHRIDAGNCPT
jgi:hypothetical protein